MKIIPPLAVLWLALLILAPVIPGGGAGTALGAGASSGPSDGDRQAGPGAGETTRDRTGEPENTSRERGEKTTRAELLGLLLEGQELFHEASSASDREEAELLYRRALYRFERIAGQGVRNAGLYYNIGNTYFRLGDLGRAVLYYRRALLLNPGDPNIRHNLDYARSRRTDRIPPDQMSAALRVLFFWHYQLPPRLKLGVFVWAFGSAGLLGALMLLAGSRLPLQAGRIRDAVVKRLVVLRAALAVLGGLSLVMLGSMAADEIRLRTLRDGVITAEQVVARRGDGTAYQPSFVDPLHQGTEFRLVEERAGWYRIRLTDGRTCWIPARAGELVVPDDPAAGAAPFTTKKNNGLLSGRNG